MKVALLQLNQTVGDLEGNARKIAAMVREAGSRGAELCVTCELSLLGYPPRDLLFDRTFIKKAWKQLGDLAQTLADCPPVLVGIAEANELGVGKPLFNTAALLYQGKVRDRFHKSLLPTYDVFDEGRYFQPSASSEVLELNGYKIGVTICEDIWNDRELLDRRMYPTDPLEKMLRFGVDFMVNLSSSPFIIGKQQIREAMLGGLAAKHRVPVLYANQVGGNDDLVFDGRSCVFDAGGRLIARGKGFEEDIVLVDLTRGEGEVFDDDFSQEAEGWKALVLGTRDYLRKCGFQKALLGLSGGIDSALTAAVAVEALGKEKVVGILMPSPYSSKGSIKDSLKLAGNLGIQTLTLPISEIMAAFQRNLQKAFAGFPEDATEENIQARIRGNLLMALSNKYRRLLLTTGNKSELSVGYCTIYGDMSGGLAVISDVPKTLVYRISKWINLKKGFQVIPREIIDKAPSAELRPDQTDQDSLPPYDLLDEILSRHVEGHRSAEELIAEGFDEQTVKKVLSLVKISEFKRKQAAPGIKITDRAFGTGWRMPIASRKQF